LKVLHIAPNSYPFLGGIEILLKNFTRFELGHSSTEHVIAFPDRSKKFQGEYKVEGTRVIPLPVLKEKIALPYFPRESYRPSEIAAVFSQYKQVLQDVKPDLIHFHDYSEASLPIISIARGMGIERVHHIHILLDYAFPKDLINNLKFETNFIAVSQAVAESIRSVIKDSADIYVIKNGIPAVSPEILETQESRIFTVLMAGRCVPSKGFDVGIKAFQILAKSNNNMKLIIAGYGKQLSVLKAITKELAIEQNVEFIKGPHPVEVLKLMRQSSVVLVPSKAEEGFSLVAAEAALCERPVVATSIGGLPETVENGISGYIVGPDNEFEIAEVLEELYANPNLRKEIGEKARIRAEKEFSMSKFAEDINSIYKKLIKE
jgi:L-malate glycosyltransferase